MQDWRETQGWCRTSPIPRNTKGPGTSTPFHGQALSLSCRGFLGHCHNPEQLLHILGLEVSSVQVPEV